MKISGFTIVRNAIKFNYPVVESIRSLLPVCDEFIVNVGDSQDATLALIQSIKDPKIKIICHRWDMSMGEEVLAYQTNLALKECQGDWAFYLQSDEVIHEDDLKPLVDVMHRELHNQHTDALALRWLHFYGSYWRYRIDAGWFQKNDRIIRNNGQIESYGDAGGFRRKDLKPLRRKFTLFLLYHYGWVQANDIMSKRRLNAIEIGFARADAPRQTQFYDFGDLDRFPAYFGSHPAVMKGIIQQHALSAKDWQHICRKFWYHPARIFRIRYKTYYRQKTKLSR